MKRINFDQLIIKPQFRGEIKDFAPDSILGFDTETKDGKARLICDSDGEICHPRTFLDCIAFLTRIRNKRAMNWFFNLDYDWTAILTWLDEKTVREYVKDDETFEFYDGPIVYKIKYVRRKYLDIRVHNYNFTFFDVHNFFPGSLKANAEKYLTDKRKYDPPVIDWAKVKVSDFHRPDMIEYCIRDSEIARDLAKILIQTCNRFGIYSKSYASQASLAAHYFRMKADVPRLSEFSQGKKLRIKTAYNAYSGGWIQIFKKGYFDRVWVYDINSAYPAEIARLPDMTKGKFVYRHGPEAAPPDATHGWIECYIDTMAKRSPMFQYNPIATYIPKRGQNYYFGGRIRATITKLEFDALADDYEITPINAYYWIPDGPLVYPYADVVNELYKLKAEYKNGDKNIYQLIKIILNGFYGKLIQKIPYEKDKYTTGPFFNPFHASYVTAACRVQAWQFIKKHGVFATIAVMTDGIALEKPARVTPSTDLGEWSIEMEQAEAVFLGSGVYTIRSKDGKVKTANRGMKSFNENFFDLLSYPENQLNDKIKLRQTLRLSVKEALRLKKYDKCNILEKGIKELDLNMDKKRDWEYNFLACLQALNINVESKPKLVRME